MGKSLRDQLAGAGLASVQQARKASKVVSKKKKQSKKEKGKKELAQKSTILSTEQSLQQKTNHQRDKLLNQKIEADREQKSQLAQAYQLADHHHLTDTEGENNYRFVLKGQVKSLRLNTLTQTKLSKGLLGIVLFEGRYLIVPDHIAHKIMQRMPDSVMLHAKSTKTEHQPEKNNNNQKENDWYADHEIPDDLIW